jgi:hypothetical protein
MSGDFLGRLFHQNCVLPQAHKQQTCMRLLLDVYTAARESWLNPIY